MAYQQNSTPRRTRILFDAFELSSRSGKSIGIYNYAKNLLTGLCRTLDHKADVLVACNSENFVDFQGCGDNVRTIVIGKGPPGKVARQLWQRIGAAIKLRQTCADVYFSPKGFLPANLRFLSPHVRSVIVIHDLIPLWYAENYPNYFGWLEQRVVNSTLMDSIARASTVIAISRATATDIEQRTGRTERVSVVLNGVPRTESTANAGAGQYLFSVGSNLPHKNARGTLEGYQQYRRITKDPLPLIFCGIDDPKVEGVCAVRSISDSQLHNYYVNARLMIFLSHVEGFGFPPLEAMAHGTEVLCSCIPALLEVTKRTAHYVDQNDPLAIGNAIAEILRHPAPDRQHISQLVAEYNWANCANEIANILLSQR
jgi:glycosyltransferase involved in cell wall biosynthesis